MIPILHKLFQKLDSKITFSNTCWGQNNLDIKTVQERTITVQCLSWLINPSKAQLFICKVEIIIIIFVGALLQELNKINSKILVKIQPDQIHTYIIIIVTPVGVFLSRNEKLGLTF